VKSASRGATMLLLRMQAEAPPCGRSLPASHFAGELKQLRADVLSTMSALAGAARSALLLLEPTRAVLRADGLQLELEQFAFAREALVSAKPQLRHEAAVEDRPLARTLGFEPLVCLPLFAGTTPLGVVLLDGASHPLHRAAVFARVAGRALASAHGRQPAAHASLAEASRVARDLHDDVAQLLFSIGSTAKAVAAGDTLPASTRARLDSIADLSGQAARRLRAAIATLRGSSSGALGLGPALDELVAATRARTTLSVELDLDPESRVAAGGFADVLYRVCREGLANVERHANATSCRLRCSFVDGWATVEVEDDGVGPDAGDDAQGFGLEFLHEAVGALGGSLDVRRRQPVGTVLTATIPPVG
jgi:signal transduction histidine kinase